MSRWRPEPDTTALLAVDAHLLAWSGGTAHHGGDAALETAFAQALDGLRAHQPPRKPLRRVDIAVGSDLACHWVQTPPASVASLDELMRVAQARRAHLFGLGGGTHGTDSDWWVTADWQATRPFVCAAVPAAPCAALHRMASAAGLQVRWTTTWGLLAGQPPANLPADGWCALRGASRLLLWRCERGHVSHLLTLPVAAHEQADAVLRRAQQSAQTESLATGAAPPGALHWIHLDAPTSEAATALQLHALLHSRQDARQGTVA